MLKVQVYDSETGRTREEKYSRSPLRIGRNPRNELCLGFGFVSGFHAKVDFNDGVGTFTDLGSTNGSTVEGRKVEANRPIQFTDGLNVTIGKLEMRFGWDEQEATSSGSYDREPRAAVPTRAPRLPTMPIQAVEDLPRDPHAPATIQHPQAMTGPTTAPKPGPGMMGGPPPMMPQGGPPPMIQPMIQQGPPMMGGGPPMMPQGGGPPPMMPQGGPPRMDGPPMMEGPPSLGGYQAPSGPHAGPPMMDGPPRVDTEPPAAPRRSGAEATGFVDLGGVHRAIRELRPAYQQYEAARAQFQQAVDAALAKIPANTRDTAMAFLRREFPEMPGANVFAAPPPSETQASASSTVTNFAAHLLATVEPPGNADEQSAFLVRIGEILQTTAQAFVEIRNVQARFGEEMGVRTIREFTPLHAAIDARAVLDCLLDWRRGGPERTAQLSAVYSDFMLHQVALINGVVEGVQAMMDQFRPAEIERGVGGLSKAAGAWKKYSERYVEVIEDRGIAALVFGPEFARAYSEVGNH